MKPLVIGVGGRSCSGKSTVAKELETKYKGEFLHIDQDKFFKIEADNWESPEALRFDKLIETIKNLKENKNTAIPTHKSTEKFDREVKPHSIIIIEGFLLFANKELNELIDKKIWVEVSDENLFNRRVKRAEGFCKPGYIMNTVIPESKKYEEMQKREADLIIDGNKPKDEMAKEVENQLRKWDITQLGN